VTRGAVAVAALLVARVAVADEPPLAGYVPGDGFVLRNADDTFKLRLGLQSAIHAQVSADGKATIEDPFLAVRPNIGGNVYRTWIRFYTSLELAANPVFLLDSYVEVQPWDALGVVVGQQSTPFSRHQYSYSPTRLLLPDWDPVATYFWTGRDKGATLKGSLADHTVDWWAGAYLGVPLRQFETVRGNYQLVGRLAVNPAGSLGTTEFAYAEKDEPAPLRYSLAVDGFLSKLNTATENFNPSDFEFNATPGPTTTANQGLGVDAILQSSRVMATAEGYYRRTDSRNGLPPFTAIGAFAQVGVLVYQRDVDVATRFSWVNPNVDVGHDQAFGIELGSTYYIHGQLAMKARYGYGHQSGPADGSTTVGGARLLTVPGPIHVATVQLNLAF
jgi:hypothetical protein